MDLAGRHLIQRTSAGTQGVVRSQKADRLLAGSFCCAQATVDCITRLSPQKVTFVVTGLGPDGRGEEDVACSEYLQALLRGTQPNKEAYVKRVRECRTSRRMFADPSQPEFLWEDIECCVSVDKFDFSMVIERQDGLLVMRPFKNERIAV
jgi:2-phosphosulfolactate phosphatase